MAFTDRKIRSFQPGEKRVEIWEGTGNGFGVIVSPSGTKTWVFRYRYDGKYKKMTFGQYPEITLAKARELHQEARRKVALGIDPCLERQTVRQEIITAPTIGQLAERFIEEHSKPKKASWKEDQRILNYDVLPRWQHRKARDIKRADVRAMLHEIQQRGKPIIVNRTLAMIRKMFNWAIEIELLDDNPCFSIRAPVKERPRERYLTEDEIRRVWHGLSNLEISKEVSLLLKLMLVTAQRKGELVHAEWKDMDLNSGWWSLPGTKTKNRYSNRIPLSRLALDLLAEVKQLSGDDPWLFPGRGNDGPIDDETPNHALMDIIENLGVAHFTPHDLRRTAGTHMTSIGVPRLVLSKIMNHIVRTTTRIYDLHTYDNEKKAALDAWGEKLASIVRDQQ
ncbi:MAG: tyrosine-type recombinase/integrase [Magnetococcales bacterium]|nr:tyrosine-type recombinase/integrase [Magnetococcales bacterium]